jgi:hypothetical protein
MLTLFSGQSGPIAHVSRILGAAAQVSEAAGDAASSVVHKGSEISSAVSSAFIDITSTSYGALRTAWHGVDLVNLKVTKISGTVTAESPQQVSSWLNSSNGRNLTSVDDEITMDTWRRMLQDVSKAIPHLARTHELLDLSGNFVLVSGEVHVTAGGRTVFVYEIARVSFLPQWANPVWALLEISHDPEHTQVLQILQQVLQAAPFSNRTLTQLGQEDSARTALLWFCHCALGALRSGDWGGANSNGNLWGGGILMIWWLCTKCVGGPRAAANPQQDAAAAATGSGATDEANVSHVSERSSASSSAASSGLFEVVGAIH